MGSGVAGALFGARACPADSKILIRIENSFQLNRNISNSKSLARRSQVVPNIEQGQPQHQPSNYRVLGRVPKWKLSAFSSWPSSDWLFWTMTSSASHSYFSRPPFSGPTQQQSVAIFEFGLPSFLPPSLSRSDPIRPWTCLTSDSPWPAPESSFEQQSAVCDKPRNLKQPLCPGQNLTCTQQRSSIRKNAQVSSSRQSQ